MKKLLLSTLILTLSGVPAVALAETQPTTNTAKTLNEIVAIVNDTPILLSQIHQGVNEHFAQLKENNQPIPPADQLHSYVLEQLILRTLQLEYAQRVGLKADENQVNSFLLNMAKQNGLSSVAELQKALDAEEAGRYKAVRQTVIDDLNIRNLQQQQLLRRVKISDQDIDLFLKSPESDALKQSQYRTLHIRIPYPDNKQGTASESQQQQALAVANQVRQALSANNVNVNQVIQNAQQNYTPKIQGGDMGLHSVANLPTHIVKQIIAMQVNDISEPVITPNGIDVIKLIDKREGNQQIIDQWSVRHILVSPSVTLSPDMAKQRIDSLYEQLRQGADFATLASTYSDDTGSANKGGSLDWVSEGQMVPIFEQTMKITAEKDFSLPFQSEYGWHILKIEGKRKHDVTDIYRRNVAREILYQRLAPQALEDWLQELKAQSYIKILS